MSAPGESGASVVIKPVSYTHLDVYKRQTLDLMQQQAEVITLGVVRMHCVGPAQNLASLYTGVFWLGLPQLPPVELLLPHIVR